MARSRRRRPVAKSATPFAGAMGRDGRSSNWESLAVDLTVQDLDVKFPNAAIVAGGITVRYKVLVPVNLTRGNVTLRRIRSSVWVMWEETLFNAAGGKGFFAVPMNIQLVPIRGGVIANEAVLDPRSAADLESNRIIWRRTWWPDIVGANGVLAEPSERFRGCRDPDYQIDVKSQRRWDRAEWALIMAVSFDTVNEVNVEMATELRGYFTSNDGL